MSKPSFTPMNELQTQRIPVQVTSAQKARITRLARRAGLPVGEFLRRSVDFYIAPEDEKILAHLLDQVEQTMTAAAAAVDKTCARVAVSNKQIDAMLAANPAPRLDLRLLRKAA